MADRPAARDLLRMVADDLRELPDPRSTAGMPEAPPAGVDPDNPLGWPGYDEHLVEARADAGTDESVVAVRGRLEGTEAVLVAWEFAFLGGSMGRAAGARVAGAYEQARRDGLPVVLLVATGGARMQEGMAALVQMPATVVAARAHAEAGLLQVAVLRDPTTGGVFASHANLADVLLAQPGATIGFAGPRVAETMTDGQLSEASHTAEGALAAGLVDATVTDAELGPTLAAIVRWAAHPRTSGVTRTTPGSDPDGGAAGGPPTGTDTTRDTPDAERGPSGGDAGATDQTEPSAWEQIQLARADHRARAGDFLDALEVTTELHGDRAGRDDPAIRVVLARLEDDPVVVVAIDRDSRNGGRVTPGGYRKAWRGLELADRLGHPLVTLVDTPGADASAASEADGIAHHIAVTFTRLLQVASPTVAVVIGEGGSGGALALAVTDRLLIQEHATFSVIAPEAAASILHRDTSRAAEVAELLRPTSDDLVDLGIADTVVGEPAGREVTTVWRAVAADLDELGGMPTDERRDRRRRRWRHAGDRV